jgi:hypothetical protein
MDAGIVTDGIFFKYYTMDFVFLSPAREPEPGDMVTFF